MMSKEEYRALAEQKYHDLQQLKSKPTLYDYEKSFDEIWQDLGRQVLEKNLSDAPADRRKKKMITRYGQIQIANSEPFSHHPNGFGISPYLQEKIVFVGQSEVYEQAAELLRQLLGLSIHARQIYRLTTHYGATIEADLDQPVVVPTPATGRSADGVVYAQADGAMLLTDGGYKENKLARICRADALQNSPVEERGGHIEASLFVAHLGTATEFSPKFKAHLNAQQGLGADLVFLSDGAPWLPQLIEGAYPQARLILDFYHRTGAPAMGHLGKVSQGAFSTQRQAFRWLEDQRKLLLNSKLENVLTNIRSLPVASSVRESVCGYLTTNRDRMDYKRYRARRLLIGSGAIESAHRTVVHKRLKRSGQRWSQAGAQRVLNLRVCWMSQRWNLVRKHIEPYSYAMAA